MNRDTWVAQLVKDDLRIMGSSPTPGSPLGGESASPSDPPPAQALPLSQMTEWNLKKKKKKPEDFQFYEMVIASSLDAILAYNRFQRNNLHLGSREKHVI